MSQSLAQKSPLGLLEHHAGVFSWLAGDASPAYVVFCCWSVLVFPVEFGLKVDGTVLGITRGHRTRWTETYKRVVKPFVRACTTLRGADELNQPFKNTKSTPLLIISRKVKMKLHQSNTLTVTAQCFHFIYLISSVVRTLCVRLQRVTHSPVSFVASVRLESPLSCKQPLFFPSEDILTHQ